MMIYLCAVFCVQHECMFKGDNRQTSKVLHFTKLNFHLAACSEHTATYQHYCAVNISPIRKDTGVANVLSEQKV